MTWSVHFIPDETDHVDVTIDGQFWHTWRSADGDVTLPLSFSKENKKIHVLAVGLEGKDAHIDVLWDGASKQEMKFDGKDGENHDVEH